MVLKLCARTPTSSREDVLTSTVRSHWAIRSVSSASLRIGRESARASQKPEAETQFAA
ncbi:hypothetical protein KNP414_04159 [Paenibacillus mucilaginosus KNP414]|nr:hypothetical protein KNP414_04159 [Paenibacillus mucilaginosus KNP414]